MPYRAFEGQNCSIADALAIVGERWTLLVLRELSLGRYRFEEIRRETGIAPNILSDRLATLVEFEIVRKRRYSERPEAYEYVPTRRGIELYPVLTILMKWGDRHLPREQGPPRIPFHEDCGHEVEPAIYCAHCDTHVESVTVRLRPGPGATPEQIEAGVLPPP